MVLTCFKFQERLNSTTFQSSFGLWQRENQGLSAPLLLLVLFACLYKPCFYHVPQESFVESDPPTQLTMVPVDANGR